MKKILSTIIILSCTLTAWTQTISTIPELTTKDICLETTHLQESQNFYNQNEEHDYTFRFIMTTDEIYDQIYIEKIVYVEEGGSKKLAWRKKLDMEAFYELGIIGEISNVGFDKWTDNDSIIISILESQFEISNLSSDSWTIKRKN